jgi:hypothetical protein
MKGYFVDAGKREITPVNYTQDTMWKWLPGGLAVARVFANGDVLYVDDEALLHPVKVAFRLWGEERMQPFVSNGVLTGRDDRDSTLPPTMSVDQLVRQIVWLTVDEAMQWFRSRANQPATTLSFDDGEAHVLNRWSDFLSEMEEKK